MAFRHALGQHLAFFEEAFESYGLHGVNPCPRPDTGRLSIPYRPRYSRASPLYQLLQVYYEDAERRGRGRKAFGGVCQSRWSNLS